MSSPATEPILREAPQTAYAAVKPSYLSDLKPYPVMKDSGVPWLGKVPEHWEVRRIKSLFRELDQRRGDGRGVLLSLTRTRGIIPQSEATNHLASAEDLSKYKVCKPGDLVMNRMQAWSGMFAASTYQGVISPDYSVFAAIDEVHVKYFEHLFKTPILVDQFAQRSKGVGSGFNRLYTPDFGTVPVAVPPRREQAAIVHFLDHSDRRIRRYIGAKQKLIALLEEQKQAIIHRAVTRGLDPNVRLKPSGVEWLGEVPEHWEVWQVGHFASVGNGSTPSRGNAAYWSGGTYPWLNSSSVNARIIKAVNQFVTDKALRECHLPRVAAGSVLVAITGQGRTRGTSALLAIEATINQHIAFLTPREPKQTASAEYLQTFLVAAYPELRHMSDDSGSTKGALTCEDLRHFRVLLPPLDEQDRIVRWVRDATFEGHSALQVAEREIALLREYRSRLIADVVTGKLNVREAAARLPDIDDEALDTDKAGGLAEGEDVDNRDDAGSVAVLDE
ncbi:MAG: restriction endonuclease subunit S [Betaproteobacteria bacterium]|nr:MAG: restriction endonuclease subunit S [Betaproteobacteria bacterium]